MRVKAQSFLSFFTNFSVINGVGVADQKQKVMYPKICWKVLELFDKTFSCLKKDTFNSTA